MRQRDSNPWACGFLTKDYNHLVHQIVQKYSFVHFLVFFRPTFCPFWNWLNSTPRSLEFQNYFFSRSQSSLPFEFQSLSLSFSASLSFLLCLLQPLSLSLSLSYYVFYSLSLSLSLSLFLCSLSLTMSFTASLSLSLSPSLFQWIFLSQTNVICLFLPLSQFISFSLLLSLPFCIFLFFSELVSLTSISFLCFISFYFTVSIFCLFWFFVFLSFSISHSLSPFSLLFSPINHKCQKNWNWLVKNEWAFLKLYLREFSGGMVRLSVSCLFLVNEVLG